MKEQSPKKTKPSLSVHEFSQVMIIHICKLGVYSHVQCVLNKSLLCIMLHPYALALSTVMVCIVVMNIGSGRQLGHPTAANGLFE